MSERDKKINPVAQSVGRRLIELREEKGMTRFAVAEGMGVKTSRIIAIELGYAAVKIDTLVRYCDVIGARIFIGWPSDE